MSDPNPSEGSEIKHGDRVLVRYGRYAGQVGEVEEVSRHQVAGRERKVARVRFKDRNVEAYDPMNLIKKDGNT